MSEQESALDIAAVIERLHELHANDLQMAETYRIAENILNAAHRQGKELDYVGFHVNTLIAARRTHADRAAAVIAAIKQLESESR